MAQTIRKPDLEAQRTAMAKLKFLEGNWVGWARVHRGRVEPLVLEQSERVEYRLDGLVMLIEGIGRADSQERLAVEALGLISYDDEANAYRMRAFNDGRFLESEIELAEDGRGLRWSFEIGETWTNSELRINDDGEWTERSEIRTGGEGAKRLMDLSVKRVEEG